MPWPVLDRVFPGWRPQPGGLGTFSREQLLALCYLMMGMGSLVFYLLPQHNYDPRANLWASALMLGLLPLTLRPRWLTAMTHLGLLLFVLLVSYIAACAGGIHSPVMVYLMVLTVPALFFLGVAGAAFWMWVVLGIYAAMLAATWLGAIRPLETAGMVPWSWLNHVLAGTMLMWMLSLFEQSHRAQLAQLQAGNLALEAASAQLLAAQSHKDEFVASVGHELRTPMNAILGLNGVLREELAGDPVDVDTVDHIRHSTEHLLHVVNDILDFAQLQSGQVRFFPEPTDVHACLAPLVSRYSARAQAKGLAWHCDVAPQLPAHIRLDPQRLTQVMAQLLDNAIKFTASGGITLRVLQRGEHLRLEVQDTGRGVALERHTQIFNRFESADVATHQAYGGTGLGLSICERLVVLQGGRIGIDSAPGHGALFWLELPLQPAAATPPAAPAASAPWPATAAFDVLLVDDNTMNRMVAQLQLRQAWPLARITTAASGPEALDKIQAQHFDVALIDMVMPGMDGLAVTQALRQLPPPLCHLPVLALTANTHPVDRQRCLDAGMNEVLHKPMDPAQMVAAVSRLMVAGPVKS